MNNEQGIKNSEVQYSLLVIQKIKTKWLLTN